MKTLILILLAAFILSPEVKAQNDPVKGITDALGSQAGMGDLLGQLMGGIKSSAFTGGKSSKSDLLGQLTGIGSSDVSKYGSLVGSLAGSLKETSFLPDWATKKDGVLSQLQTASSIADIAGGTSNLLGMLDPKIFKGGFKKNMGTFTSALGLLSLVK